MKRWNGKWASNRRHRRRNSVLVVVPAAAIIGRTVIILVIAAASLVVIAVIIGSAFPGFAVAAAVRIANKLHAGLPGKPRGWGRAEQERHADRGNG
jgi:hypothetical protein